ncbi:MAG: response regulator [Lachnospiraceae bacterium]|nr:response regulator [Lachnospiraceae bacterium]
MYRLLVVDDEEMITDSLARMLEETERYELDIYKAYSGREALRLLNEYSFDIVISDISMPGMSGVDLAGIICRRWPLCHVIFQTGYEDFEYARQAIRHKVAHYILKNEGDEVLLGAIGECIQAIEHDTDIRKTLEKAKEGKRIYDKILRMNTLQGMLWKKDLRQEERARLFDETAIRLNPAEDVMLLAGRIEQERTDELSMAADMILKEKTGYAVLSEIIWMDKHVILWVLQPAKTGELEYARAVIKGMAENIKRTIEKISNLRISFVFQEEPAKWERLPETFEHLYNIVSDCLTSDWRIAMAGADFFEERDQKDITENGANVNLSFVRRLEKYMRGHIGEDLTLCALSEKVHLNASYLSRRYKELAGRTLSEAILEMRMEAACDMLQNTNLKISEVANRCGYESVPSFTRVFKKMKGVTPQSWRDGHAVIL